MHKYYFCSQIKDNIEANVEFAATRVEAGNKQLIKAVKHKVRTSLMEGHVMLYFKTLVLVLTS